MKPGWPAWLPPLSRYEVAGESMAPAFRSGERLLINRLAYVARAPRPGDVVIFRDPERRERLLLKRVLESRDGWCFVRGDNLAASRDSRHFGPIKRADVIGKVLLRY